MNSQINLRWNSHKTTVFSMFDTLLSTESLVDVTLACEGKYLRAHKVVLSACSPYFQEMLTADVTKAPILYLHGVKHVELEALVQYMYHGEVSVSHAQLASFLEIAKDLQIRGLADVSPSSSNNSYDDDTYSTVNSTSHIFEAPPPPPLIRSSNANSASPYRNDEGKPVIRKKVKVDKKRTKPPQHLGFVPTKSPKLLQQLSSAELKDSSNSRNQRMTHDESSDEPEDAANLLKLEVREGHYKHPGEPELVELEEDDNDGTAQEYDLWDQGPLDSSGFDANSPSMMPDQDDIAGGSRARIKNDFPMPKFFDDLSQNRQKRSGVWQHFTTVGSEDEPDSELFSQCNYCDRKYKRSTSTTNMKSHLNVSHQIFF